MTSKTSSSQHVITRQGAPSSMRLAADTETGSLIWHAQLSNVPSTWHWGHLSMRGGGWSRWLQVTWNLCHRIAASGLRGLGALQGS